MQTALTCLELVARLNQVDADMRAVVRQYGIGEQEISAHELARIARNLGFKAKLKTLPIDRLPTDYPLPAIFLAKDGSFGVLLKLNAVDRKLLAFLPSEKSAQELTFDRFRELATDTLLVMSPKLLSDQVRFGYKWFCAEIIKYRQVILEVMTGSFIVQLFGLVTPLFTQVILDKVVQHRTLTTLDVLAIAFLFVICFEFLLNLTRNYIFIHTANKIDAKLGAKLFRHLFSLPFVYFESRKVGTIAARVRELDNIREFSTT